jgi:hypothetical protein
MYARSYSSYFFPFPQHGGGESRSIVVGSDATGPKQEHNYWLNIDNKTLSSFFISGQN